MRGRHFVLAVYLAACSTTAAAERITVAQAEPKGAQAVLDQITGEVGFYEAMRERLSSADPATRMAAFNAMATSGNPTLVSMALEQGFNGDAAMQAAALRHLGAAMSARAFELGASENASAELKKQLARWGYGVSFSIEQSDVASGKFIGNAAGRRVSGQVSGRAVSFTSDLFSGSFVLNEDNTSLVGTIRFPSAGEPAAAQMPIR